MAIRDMDHQDALYRLLGGGSELVFSRLAADLDAGRSIHSTGATTLSLAEFTYGDGITDDTDGFQAAIDEATRITAPGKWCIIEGRPDDTYLLNTWHGTIYSWLLEVHGDRIIIDLKHGKIRSTVAPPAGSSQVIFPHGGGKIGSPGNYSTGGTWYPVRTLIPFAAAPAAGAHVVQVTDASTVSVGDVIFIGTGNLVGDASGPLWPDSEVNEVVAKAGNFLTVRWPLEKAYLQEYYVTGTTGFTSTSVTANLAPWGIRKVTDCTMRDFTLRNVTWDVPLATYACYGFQCIGMKMEGFRGQFGVAGTAVQYVRSSEQVDYLMTKGNADLAAGGAMIAGAAAGCSEVLIDRVHGSGQYPMIIHLHEGVSSWIVRNSSVKTKSAPGTTDQGGFSARSRTYNGRLIDCDFVGGTGNGCVVIDNTCVKGGIVRGVTARSTDAGAAVDMVVQGTGWQVTENRTYKGLTLGGGNTGANNLVGP